MGAFKKKPHIIHINEYGKTFFFSIDHLQEFEGDEAFVPITFYKMSAHEITETCLDRGYKEIDNPDPDYKP